MRHSFTIRQAGVAVALIAVTQFALQLGLLARGVEYVAGSLAIDDTYYYLQTAWNTKQLGFVTFDGLHATNGVQLAWFVVILLLATVANSKIALLFMSLMVGFLLNGLCYLVILNIAAAVKQPALALFLAQNLFNGHGEFVTRVCILVCHMAERCVPHSGAQWRPTQRLGLNGGPHSQCLGAP
jgi:hypothetical protein